ncbi:hypothetical protein FNU79_09410 [Deinococcus detaillensis]|uniref:DUF1772 domain-containing protein n=1 Tax=Deinococcus detaillensis TaxID=2592048 RepID=A0A553UZP9_9DEIO|nr:hypothetical protein [Deinococcus detaillensis]TSA85660.1 hypothetical protein FNU79_09410 [Deinococcus detaillensis]
MLLLVHAALTFMLVGLILTVQLVHYPLFARVGATTWPAYEREHQNRITFLVGPLMLAELLSAGWLALHPPPPLPSWSVWLGLALTLLIWLSTALVQSPLHGRLSAAFDARLHRQLVVGNWFRTLVWLLRGGLCLWWLTLLL